MMSHHYTKSATPDPSKRYSSDLDDDEFERIAPLVAQKQGSGKKRTVDIRRILNAIFYRVRTGCQWRMFPKDFRAWYHVWYYYRVWRNDGTWECINTYLFSFVSRYQWRRNFRQCAGNKSAVTWMCQQKSPPL